MNRDRLFDEMGGIRDAYILSAADLLGYEKEDKLMHLPQTARVRKMTRAILIAAAITALLAAVSVLSLDCTKCPSLTPALSAAATSLGEKSPSGPIRITTSGLELFSRASLMESFSPSKQ